MIRELVLVTSAAFALTACPPPRPVTPPVIPTAQLTVSAPAGAAVTLQTPAYPAGPSGVAGPAGTWTTTVPSPGDYDVNASLDGFTCTSVHIEVRGLSFTVTVPCAAIPPKPVEPPAPVYIEPTERPHLEGRGIADEHGVRPRMGVSLFWLAWGYRNDRTRVEANLKDAADHGFDFVRAFGEVCGNSWSDREVRPDWPDYVDVLRGSTRLAMKYGMRVKWTLFAGGCYSRPDEWYAAAEKMITALEDVLPGVMLVEVTNEQQLPDRNVTREIGRRVRARLGTITALSGTPEAELPQLYVDSAANFGILHPDRKDGDFGWRSARQMWGYWELQSMPKACGNGEPAGLASSVRAENDPLRIGSDALVTWISGCAYYVLHNGAGIYGRDYVHPTAGRRFANLWEQPGWEASAALVRKVRDALPADVMNWQRANNHWTAPNPVPPARFRQDQLGDAATQSLGLCRAYWALGSSGNSVGVVLGARGTLSTEPVKPFTGTAIDLKTWEERPWTGTIQGTDTTYLVRGRIQ